MACSANRTCRKFLLDANFIEMVNGGIIDITPKGRDYLNNIRNSDIWEKTKLKLQPLGAVAFDIVSEVGKSYIFSKLGL